MARGFDELRRRICSKSRSASVIATHRRRIWAAATVHMAELAEIPVLKATLADRTPGLGFALAGHASKSSLMIDTLLALPLATQRRLLRGWLEERSRITNLISAGSQFSRHSRAEAGTRMGLSPRWTLRRTRQEILLEPVLNSGDARLSVCATNSRARRT